MAMQRQDARYQEGMTNSPARAPSMPQYGARSVAKSTLALSEDDYMPLERLSVALTRGTSHEEGSFTLCFWMYLLKSTGSGVVIRQGRPHAVAAIPFLTLDSERRLSLHPLPPPVNSAPNADGSSGSAASKVVIAADTTCPLEKWIHIGCEVGPDIARLHIDTLVVGQRPVAFPPQAGVGGDAGPVLLSGGDGSTSGGAVQSYAHYVRLLPRPTVSNHYVKNPPLELTLDGTNSAADDNELEDSGDGVWSVVGGKASCRRNFSLDVALVDALGRSVHRDMEVRDCEIQVVAALVFADDGSPVQKPRDDAEAPLLTTFDGVEFPSTERPVRLVHGRASFKLKISQLSSKCDNRLFRVCFEAVGITPKYPFLRALSRPIRCVSRNRNSRGGANHLGSIKRPLGGGKPIDDRSPGQDDASISDTPHSIHKRPRTDYDIKPADAGFSLGPSSLGLPYKPEQVSPSTPGYDLLDPRLPPTGLGPSMTALLGSSGAQTPGAQGGGFGGGNEEQAFPDNLVFKYCLESMCCRADFLKAAALQKSEEELAAFAQRVSNCTGCRHNGHQILISKRLLKGANEVWQRVAGEAYSVQWTELVNHVEEHFCSLASTALRRFTPKDKEFLRHIAGCEDQCTREEFDRLWQWIYPIGLTLALPQLRRAWETLDPPVIMGMISRDEAEQLLRTSQGRLGTFLLRFASSRLWPHPDAGALVVSYVGEGGQINHKLLTVDDNPSLLTEENEGGRPLLDLLHSQPELKVLHRPSPEPLLEAQGHGIAQQAAPNHHPGPNHHPTEQHQLPQQGQTSQQGGTAQGL